MFDFFETMAELFDAVELHRIWLIGLTIIVAIIIWKNLTKSLKIDKLENEIEMMKEEIKEKVEEQEKEIYELKTQIRILEAKMQSQNDKKA